MKYKLTLAFDGAHFAGWQAQKNALTVQEELTKCSRRVLGEDASVTGASRTDSGVHAKGFVCHVECQKELEEKKVVSAINHYVDNHISVLNCEKVPDDFHARYSARSKEYHYLILNSAIHDPFLNSRAWLYPKHLDEERMNECAKEFIGSHDFTSFMASGSKITDTVREIYSASVERDGDKLWFKVCGNGFLYNMVRIMTGTLADIATKKTNKSVTDIILAKDRAQAGVTAPACGLYLYRINY